jgi:hypothetical protein
VSNQKAKMEEAAEGAELEEACGVLARQVRGMCITTWGKNGSIMQVSRSMHFYVCTQGTYWTWGEWAWRHHKCRKADLRAVTLRGRVFPRERVSLVRIADCMLDG